MYMKHLFSACLLACLSCGAVAQTSSKAVLPYQDTQLSPEQRAEDLLKRLTLEEKALLMQDNSQAIPRLQIKQYNWWNEALHGVARAGLATVFPQSIGMAASFDDTLLHEVFTAVSEEARAKNRQFNEKGQYKRYQCLTMWTPNINIFRDPRWGRGQETYGEDPYLSGRMGTAVVGGYKAPKTASTTSCTLAPNTLPYTPVRNGTDIVSMRRTSTCATCGRRIFRLSKSWYKRPK